METNVLEVGSEVAVLARCLYVSKTPQGVTYLIALSRGVDIFNL